LLHFLKVRTQVWFFDEYFDVVPPFIGYALVIDPLSASSGLISNSVCTHPLKARKYEASDAG
jgi:hypothetical protein